MGSFWKTLSADQDPSVRPLRTITVEDMMRAMNAGGWRDFVVGPRSTDGTTGRQALTGPSRSGPLQEDPGRYIATAWQRSRRLEREQQAKEMRKIKRQREAEALKVASSDAPKHIKLDVPSSSSGKGFDFSPFAVPAAPKEEAKEEVVPPLLLEDLKRDIFATAKRYKDALRLRKKETFDHGMRRAEFGGAEFTFDDPIVVLIESDDEADKRADTSANNLDILETTFESRLWDFDASFDVHPIVIDADLSNERVEVVESSDDAEMEPEILRDEFPDVAPSPVAVPVKSSSFSSLYTFDLANPIIIDLGL